MALAPAPLAPRLNNARRLAAPVFAVVALAAALSIGASPALAASATWSPPVDVTNDQSLVVGAVTAPDGTITVVTENSASGITAVSSFDSGASWETPVPLGSGGEYAYRPTIGTTSTGLLAVAWVEAAAGVNTIPIVISADGGSTWSMPTLLPTSGDRGDFPVIGSAGPLGFTVVWNEGNFDMAVSSTTDGGVSWSPRVVIDEAADSSGTADITSVGADDLVVVYQDFAAGAFSIQSRRSTDAGVTWEPAVTVGPAWNDTNTRYNLVVSPTTGAAVAVWSRGRVAPGDAIFASTSTDGGANWSAAIEISAGAGSITYFDVAVVDASTAAVVWHQEVNGGSEIYYSEVEVGATSGSLPVAIVPPSSRYADRLPTITTFGTTRVATWFEEGDLAADTVHLSAVSCDGGATWRAATAITAGEDVRIGNAIVARAGTVVTALWVDGDFDLATIRSLASSIDDPCSVAVVAPDVVEPELADTGASVVSFWAFGVALAMLVAGLTIVGIRRSATQR